jgi:hypothetical protein
MTDLARLSRLVTHLTMVREIQAIYAARPSDARTLEMRAVIARDDAETCAELMQLAAKVTGPDALMTEGPSCGAR